MKSYDLTESRIINGDYPQFPTDTASEQYNEVSHYYSGQIKKLKLMIEQEAPPTTIYAQLKHCHGLAIGLDESNWLACVNQAHKLETNRQDTVSALSRLELEAQAIFKSYNMRIRRESREHKPEHDQQLAHGNGMYKVLNTICRIMHLEIIRGEGL